VSFVHRCTATGAELRVVRCDASGDLDREDPRTQGLGPSPARCRDARRRHRGYTAPVADLAAVAEEHEAFFLLDAA
jgi:selenocysteine lyase/cysteine desulfurase